MMLEHSGKIIHFSCKRGNEEREKSDRDKKKKQIHKLIIKALQ